MTLGEYLGAGSAVTRWASHLNGNSNDYSGNGNNGVDTGITYSQANGRFGQGAGFAPASSSRITVGSPTCLRITDALTLLAWINAASVAAGSRGVLSKWADPPTKYGYILAQSGADMGFHISGDGSVVVSCSVAGVVSASVWDLFVGVFTPSTSLILYKNGAQIGINTTSIPASIYDTTTQNFRVGASGGSSDAAAYFFNGAIDEPIAEGVAWSASAVRKYYTWAKGRFGI